MTGTLGRALLDKILGETDHWVMGISRDEQKQRTLPQHERFKAKLADIRDIDSISHAVGRHHIDVVFHLAALKCVDTLEENRLEAIKTNVWGTQNLCSFFEGNARVVLASTDKACYPINTYGMTKALAEKIVLQNPQNCVVRYGNVLGSRGSLLPSLIKSLRETNTAYLTDENMTRFWLPIDRVKDFVYEIGMSELGGLFTPKDIKSCYVKDLIKVVASILEVNPTIEKIPIRAGEKLHECLTTQFETENMKDIHSNDNSHLMINSEIKDLLSPIIKEM